MMRVKPYLISAALLLVASGTLGIPLEAQVPPGWVQVDTGKTTAALIGAKILPATGGYQVYFKNFGTTPVHFGFYLQGAQTEDAVPTNGRVHLKARNPVGPINLPSLAGTTAPLELRVVALSVGNEDTLGSTAE